MVHEPPQQGEREVEVELQRCREGNHRRQHQRRDEGHGGGREEEHPRRLSRPGFLLQDVLEPVGHRLQQPGPAGAVGSAPVLHPRGDLALQQREQRHGHHDDGKHRHQLDDAEQQEPLEFRGHRAAPAVSRSCCPTQPIER